MTTRAHRKRDATTLRIPVREEQRVGWRLISVAAILPALVIGGAFASSGDARAILDERRQLYDTVYAWSDQHQVVRVEIEGPNGARRQRTLEIYERRYSDGATKSRLSFLAPDTVKGTAILLHTSGQGRASNQWLYLPVFKRARRIGRKMKDERFVGTDLTHGDLEIMQAMTRWSDDEAPATLLTDSASDESTSYVIELMPRLRDVAYDRIVMWISQGDLILRRLEMRDASGQIQKIIVPSEIRVVGETPVAHRMEVLNPPERTRTIFEVAEIEFDIGFPESVLSVAAFSEGGA